MRALRPRLFGCVVGTLTFLSPSPAAQAMCDVIPGVTQKFRGALGSLNRPFAIPLDEGQDLTITLAPARCDAGSAGFIDRPGGAVLEDDYLVTILFEPPGEAPANAVVFHGPNAHATCEARVAEAGPLPGGGAATCQRGTCSLDSSNGGAACTTNAGCPNGSCTFDDVEIPSLFALRFRFPDTDALVAGASDRRTFTGPATIAVTPSSDPLPVALVGSARCADTVGLLACVDELYTEDGTCETTAPHRNPVFGHFTALPPANDYAALCETPDPVCAGLGSDLRFTVDAAGNVLVPMDYRDVLIVSDDIPIPRIVRGFTGAPAFSSDPLTPVTIPSDAFVRSFAPGGQQLPPLFTPVSNPGQPGAASFLGSVDAPVGTIRVQRRGCLGGAAEGSACTTNGHCGAGSTCATLFDFSDRLAGGVGPVVLADSEFELHTEHPVLLDGLVESDSVLAFVVPEALEGPLGARVNADSDTTDPVLRIRSRVTGEITPIGASGAEGRAITRVNEGAFGFAALSVAGNHVAFLEFEPLEGDCADRAACDTNGNGSISDSILRLYELAPDCGGGVPCALELPASGSLAVEEEPLVEGGSLVESGGLFYFRVPEWRVARRATEEVGFGSIAGHHSRRSSLSGDGRFVAFDSDEPSVFDDPPLPVHPNVMRRDRVPPRELVVASKTVDGDPGNGASLLPEHEARPAISADGRTIVFNSLATNLNGPSQPNQLYLYDAESDSLRRISMSEVDGSSGNARSWNPGISGDGRVIVFQSDATNLVDAPIDANGVTDVYVLDRDADGDGIFDEPGGADMKLVSVDALGQPGAGPSGNATISVDGRWVGFGSNSPLAAPAQPHVRHVYVRDLTTETTELVSINDRGEPGDNNSFTARVSAGGRFVAYLSFSTNLAAPGSGLQGYLYDRLRRRVELFSVNSAGEPAERGIFPLSGIAFDGRRVAFESASNNLVAEDLPRGDDPNDPGPQRDILAFDRVTGQVELISVADDGSLANRDSGVPSLSGDGRVVAFGSAATNLTPAPDLNGASSDVYVRAPAFDAAADLSGDGDVGDLVLTALDPKTGSLTPVCPASTVALAAGDAAFIHPTGAGPCPGSAAVPAPESVHLFVPARGVMDLGRSATAIDLSPQALAAIVPTPSGSGRVQVYDRAAGAWRATGQAADSIAVAGRVAVFTTPEAAQDADLNADGDKADRVVQLFDLDTRVTTPTGRAAEEMVVAGSLVAFRSSEAAQGKEGEDLNGDEDTSDAVLQVYDLAARRLFNTMSAATPCPLAACDPRFPYRVDADTVVFLTLERDQGMTDLNDDGDRLDLVLQRFNVREAAQLAVGAAMPRGVDSIAASSAGICIDSGDPCALDDDCATGACFLPPGSCIERLGTTCACELGACSDPCPSGEFCIEGSCHADRGPCASQSDCSGGAVCRDAATDIQRLFSPIAQRSGEALYSSGRCARACGTDDECPGSDTCSADGVCGRRRGSCRNEDDCAAGFECLGELIVAGAADADADGLADPFDNCPGDANIAQIDSDGDGVGDACDLETCGNGVREFSEDCDDGNGIDDDGCSAKCTTVVGELIELFDQAVSSERLTGTGNGHAAPQRLAAERKLLEQANRSFLRANPTATCRKLDTALVRTDGEARPPDFVRGDAAPELASRIRDLHHELGCAL